MEDYPINKSVDYLALMRQARQANKSLDVERYKRELKKLNEEVPNNLSNQIEKVNKIKIKAYDLEERAKRQEKLLRSK